MAGVENFFGYKHFTESQMRALWGVIAVRRTDVKSTNLRSTANIYGAF